MTRRAKTRAKPKVNGSGRVRLTSKPKFPSALGCEVADEGPSGTAVGMQSARLRRYNRQRLLAAATREPLDYRRAHDPLSSNGKAAVERLARSVPDASGGIGNSHRAHDTLSILLKNGTIRDQEHDAGREFEEDFALARLDPLHASDPGRIPGGRQLELNDAIVAGRGKVRASMTALGGPTTPIGSAAWCILGLGQTLREWAGNCQFGQGGRSLDERVAKGVFLAALNVLALHYGKARR